MLKVKLEYPRIDPDDGPVMYVDLYDENNNIIIETIMSIVNYTNFTVSRIYNGEFTHNSMGNSGRVDYAKLVKSGIPAKEIKHIIHGQIILCVSDFIGIITDLKLVDGDIKFPMNVTARFIDPDIDVYIGACYKYLRSMIKKASE